MPTGCSLKHIFPRGHHMRGQLALLEWFSCRNNLSKPTTLRTLVNLGPTPKQRVPTYLNGLPESRRLDGRTANKERKSSIMK